MRDLTKLSDQELGNLAGCIIERRATGLVTDSDGTPLREMYEAIYEEVMVRDARALREGIVIPDEQLDPHV